jgi:hypothetical protein
MQKIKTNMKGKKNRTKWPTKNRILLKKNKHVLTLEEIHRYV